MGKNWGNKEINHKYVLTACRKYQKWLLRVKNCFWEMRKGGTGVFCESQGERGGSGSRMSLKWWGLQSVRLGIYPLAKAESVGVRDKAERRAKEKWENISDSPDSRGPESFIPLEISEKVKPTSCFETDIIMKSILASNFWSSCLDLPGADLKLATLDTQASPLYKLQQKQPPYLPKLPQKLNECSFSKGVSETRMESQGWVVLGKHSNPSFLKEKKTCW